MGSYKNLAALDLDKHPYWTGLMGSLEAIASNDVDLRDLVSAGAAAGLSVIKEEYDYITNAN